MSVWQYSLERYQNHLHLSYDAFSPNMNHLRSAPSLAMTACSGQILSERGKTEPKMLPLEFSPSPKGSWGILHLWHNCPLVQFSNKMLPLLQNLICFQDFAEFCALTLLSSRYNFGSATRVSHVRMREKLDKVSTSLFFSVYWFPFRRWSRFRITQVTSCCPKQNFSSNRQLPEIITLKLLILWGWIDNHWKDEKVSYDVSIEGFLWLHSIWGKNFRILRMYNSAQQKISAARLIFKNT
jgi:hypothetical protein